MKRIQIILVNFFLNVPVAETNFLLNIYSPLSLVLLADVAIFFPAVILFFIQQRLQSQEKVSNSEFSVIVCMCSFHVLSYFPICTFHFQVKLSLVVLLYPGFLLIDHGHFQYPFRTDLVRFASDLEISSCNFLQFSYHYILKLNFIYNN